LWTLGDVLFAPGAAAGDFWRERVALFATLAIVGLPVWLLHWRPRAGSADEARSLARRLYVYLSLIAAMLAAIGSIAGALYRLLGLALGGALGQDITTDLAHAVALASVAVLILVYHWRVLRADGRLAESPSTTAVVAEPVTTSSVAIVEIHAADAESLNRALSALRQTGVEVTVR
jgi:thioesterase domain-containing protein